jgi:hypothetical protein
MSSLASGSQTLVMDGTHMLGKAASRPASLLTVGMGQTKIAGLKTLQEGIIGKRRT